MTDVAKLSLWGQQVLDIEIEALQHLRQSIFDSSFAQACQAILACQGKLVVMGIGKSGHIGKKMAATFASTGTSSFFVHPSEAAHGDLGMIEANDIALLISNSGESPELSAVLPMLKRKGIDIISLTGNPDSSVAQCSHINISIAVPQEACPLGLAPTASTTATLAMGDSLAVALLSSKGFTANDFALSHPGGKLGKTLLLRVQDIMKKSDDLPIVFMNASLSQALLEISQKGLGMAIVVDEHHKLQGIFTDGDLRRAFETKMNIHDVVIGDVMTTSPLCIDINALAAQALYTMEQHQIHSLIITNHQQEPVGSIQLNDLIKAGLS